MQRQRWNAEATISQQTRAVVKNYYILPSLHSTIIEHGRKEASEKPTDY